jgi:hypothetical protein
MRLPIAIVAAVTLCCVATSVPWAAEPFQPAPQEGVLLLANGQILRGKITHGGDHYYVALDDGEIRLKASEVEIFCRTIEDGYERKRLGMLIGDADEHLDLAQWCIQHKLFGCAARELGEAMRLEPNHPKIAVLERRLQLAMNEQDVPQEAPPPGKPSLSNDELDRMVRGMPDGTVEAFSHTIQPMLLNNCTTSGCHGPGSTTSFSLLRIPLGRTPSRRLTQRNLHAALAQINTSAPSQSLLLAMSVREHGGARTAVFTSREVLQYRQLVAWVYRVSRAALPAEAQAPLATSLERRAEPLLQSMPPPLGPPSAPPAVTTTVVEKKQAPDHRYVPIDPFDPEAFNRQSAPR